MSTLLPIVRAATSPLMYGAVTEMWRRRIEDWPEWIQPTGGNPGYALNGQVTHQGQRWVSLFDANVWEPDVFGWELYEDTP